MTVGGGLSRVRTAAGGIGRWVQAAMMLDLLLLLYSTVAA